MVCHSTLEGTGICIDAKASHSAVHTSKIICLAVETPILKLLAIVVIASPVARYLCGTSYYTLLLYTLQNLVVISVNNCKSLYIYL